MVAPFTGAWIEMICQSLRIGVREVAPFTGAWIEIDVMIERIYHDDVAPFTGAWIEIRRWPRPVPTGRCRSLYGGVD